VRLRYERGAGAEHCPDELALRNAVSARLGYDPFDDDATRAVDASITRRADVLLGRVEVQTEEGDPGGSRQISSRQNDCSELASALSLAISIAIDPLSLSKPPLPAAAIPAPPPSPLPRAERPCPPPPEPAPAEEPASPITFRASAGAHVALGAAPTPAAFGLDIDAGLRWRALSIDLGGRADIPMSSETPSGTIATSLLFATVAPCGHVSFFSGCALGAFGAMRGEHVDLEQRDSVPFVALGARAAAEVPIYEVVGLRIFADLLAPLIRTGVIVRGQEVWRAPVVQGAIGLAVQGDFP
jgi:hypothetical protein